MLRLSRESLAESGVGDDTAPRLSRKDQLRLARIHLHQFMIGDSMLFVPFNDWEEAERVEQRRRHFFGALYAIADGSEPCSQRVATDRDEFYQRRRAKLCRIKDEALGSEAESSDDGETARGGQQVAQVAVARGGGGQQVAEARRAPRKRQLVGIDSDDSDIEDEDEEEEEEGEDDDTDFESVPDNFDVEFDEFPPESTESEEMAIDWTHVKSIAGGLVERSLYRTEHADYRNESHQIYDLFSVDYLEQLIQNPFNRYRPCHEFRLSYGAEFECRNEGMRRRYGLFCSQLPLADDLGSLISEGEEWLIGKSVSKFYRKDGKTDELLCDLVIAGGLDRVQDLLDEAEEERKELRKLLAGKEDEMLRRKERLVEQELKNLNERIRQTTPRKKKSTWWRTLFLRIFH